MLIWLLFVSKPNKFCIKKKNPPASHAHTLLLDLDQLKVVVAKLDKIKYDSSTLCPVFSNKSTSYQSSVSSSTNVLCNNDIMQMHFNANGLKRMSAFDNYLNISKSRKLYVFIL